MLTSRGFSGFVLACAYLQGLKPRDRGADALAAHVVESPRERVQHRRQLRLEMRRDRSEVWRDRSGYSARSVRLCEVCGVVRGEWGGVRSLSRRVPFPFPLSFPLPLP